MTITSTTVSKNSIEEMEYSSQSTEESEVQYLDALSKTKLKVKVAQSCPTVRNPGILQARILEWVAFPLSSGSSQPRNGTLVSCIAGRFFSS